MRRVNFTPTDWAWAFVGFGLMCFLIGSGWSVSQAKVYQLEMAEYKLAVGSALSEVKKVSNTLEKSAGTLPIESIERQEIEATTEKIDEALEVIEADIDRDIDSFILKQQDK